MLDHIQPTQLLFLDIETVPQYAMFEQAPPKIRELWAKKAQRLKGFEEGSEAQIYERAGIYAEFGKIICISVGWMSGSKSNYSIRIKSFASTDESELLDGFVALVAGMEKNREVSLCAHNGKEFDFPYIARRLLVNGKILPSCFDVAGKKPWEIHHIDTMDLWRFGDFKSYTSLELLAEIFGLKSPKDDIDGSQVGKVFWQENDLGRIKKYCQNDVLTIAQLFLRYKGLPIIADNKIEFVD